MYPTINCMKQNFLNKIISTCVISLLLLSAIPTFHQQVKGQLGLGGDGLRKLRSAAGAEDESPVDMSNKFIQRVTAGGTTYTAFNNPVGKAMFTRRIQDTNRHFILFPDHAYPPGKDCTHNKYSNMNDDAMFCKNYVTYLLLDTGSGNYIVLRRMMMKFRAAKHELVYEAFTMHLTSSARAMVVNWPNEGPNLQGHHSPGSDGAITNSTQRGFNGHNPYTPIENPIDVGEVVARRLKRKISMPDFQTIHVNLNSEEYTPSTQVEGNDEDFNGFSIEAEE